MKLRVRFLIPLTLLLIMLSAVRIFAAPATDGDLDPSFSDDGLVFAPGRDVTSQAHALALQPDGKIVIAGEQVSATGAAGWGITRLLPNGSLDDTFGGGSGTVMRDLATEGDTAVAVKIQPDGKIVVLGGVEADNTVHLGVGRFNADGSVDSTFGIDGVTHTNFGVGYETAAALLLQPDGKIVVGGSSAAGWSLARFNANGALDSTFGTNGQVTVNSLTFLFALALQPDGKIVGTGDVSGAPRQIATARFSASGQLDDSFGTLGRVLTPAYGDIPRGQAIAIYDDGRIIVAGTGRATENEASGFVLLRYNSSGQLDASLGGAGVLFSGSGGEATSIALQADGKIIVGGTYSDAQTSSFSLARYNAAGSRDASFGSNGQVLTTFHNFVPARLYALALQSDGNIVAAGDRSQYHYMLARYLNAASPVPTSTPTVTPIPATPTSGPGCIFSDVCPSDYWFTPVQQLIRLGAISGYDNNTFRPLNNTTRAQLAKIVVVAEAFQLVTPDSATFSDVPSDNPFFSYVETAAAHQIVGGYDDGSFRPFNNVTRGQLAKIVVIAAVWTLVDPARPTFNDVARDNPFYKYVETAHDHGIISGYGDGSFKWTNNATRGQIAKIVAAAVTTPGMP